MFWRLTLADLLPFNSQATAHRNMADIDSIANIPTTIAMSLVKRATTAQQLHTLEVSNPEVATETGDLWRAFIKRDMPNLKPEHMYEPKNPRSWHKVYKKIKREEEAREAAQEEALRKTLLGDKVKKAENQAVFVDKIMSHARSGNESSVFVDGVRKQRQSGSEVSVSRAKTGAQAIAAIRRQAAQNSRAISHAQPFKASPAPARQITQAPQSMVRELNQRGHLEIQPRELAPHQKELLRENRKMQPRIMAPGRLATAKNAEIAEKRNAAAVAEARQINEAKLRAFTQSENAKAATRPPAKRFELEPAPVTFRMHMSRSSQQPHTITMSASPPQTTASASAAPTPAKRISISVSPPVTPPQKPTGPTVVKKRAAPPNIFMSNKKVKR